MGWYEAMKDLGSVAETIKNAELHEKLAKVRMECAALAEENARLREERMELAEQLKVNKQLNFKDNVYWHSDGDEIEGPFCPKCWDGDKKQARIVDKSDGWWICPVCNFAVPKPGRQISPPVMTAKRYDPFNP